MSGGIDNRLPVLHGAERRLGDIAPMPAAMVLRRAADGPRMTPAEPRPERPSAFLPSAAFIAQVLGQRSLAPANDAGFAAYRATQVLGRDNPVPVRLLA